MLYNKRWDAKVETKADPLTLPALIAWLEKQPADAGYNYCQPETCLIAQYLKASGLKKFCLMSREVERLGWMDIVHPISGDWTFGAALQRARALAE